MVDNYLQTIKMPQPDSDNPYFESWNYWTPKPANWYANPDTAFQSNVAIAIGDQRLADLNKPILPLVGDDGTISQDIEYLGTRYYTIDAPTTPLTGTLELTFRLDHSPAAFRAYDLTFLDVTLDPATKRPNKLLRAANMRETNDNVFRVSNFGGANRRVVVVASKVENISDDIKGFTLDVGLTSRGTQPAASPSPFSPNHDGRKDSAAISYFLPPFAPSSPDNLYDVTLAAIDGTAPPRTFARVTQPMSQTSVYTWTGNLEDGSVLGSDGQTEKSYTLQVRAQEAPGRISNGQFHTYTTTVIIDTKPPAAVANLTFTAGTPPDPHHGDPTGNPDVLRWNAISDSSPGGARYLVFQSTAPITSTDGLTPFKRTSALTETLVTFPHVPSSRYFAVQAEDAASNRDQPALVEADQGKLDLLLIVDDSTSMVATELQDGVTASQTLIDALEDKDRVAIRDIAAVRPSLPFTLLDRAARATAKSTLAAYATANDSGSPMDAALQWALAQFDQPGIANDGRPHYIAAFTDGEWSVTQATTQTLQTKGINVFGVTTPRAGSGPAAVRQLVQATNGPRADLRFFNRADVAASYRDLVRTLRGKIVQISAGSLAPGTTQDSTIPIDTAMPEAIVEVTWDPAGPPLVVTLTAPDGRAIDATSLPAGASFTQSAGVAHYALLVPPLPPGTWTIHIAHPGLTPSLSAAAPQAAASGSVAYTLQTAARSTITTTLRLLDPPALELAALDAGEPLTDTTFIWADLVSSQGFTQTVILHDDGLGGDRAAGDGVAYTSLFNLPRPAAYDKVIATLRHFDPRRGFVERQVVREIHIAVPDQYEADDAPAQARPIAVSETQTHTLHLARDQDWLSFAATAGGRYRVELTNRAQGIDPALQLYAGDGSTLISGAARYVSAIDGLRMDVRLPQAGTYYIKVSDPRLVQDAEIADGRYSVRLSIAPPLVPPAFQVSAPSAVGTNPQALSSGFWYDDGSPALVTPTPATTR
jgi:hypothetical protein